MPHEVVPRTSGPRPLGQALELVGAELVALGPDARPGDGGDAGGPEGAHPLGGGADDAGVEPLPAGVDGPDDALGRPQPDEAAVGAVDGEGDVGRGW